MLEKTKKFVSDHKSHIATAAISAAVAGVGVYLYYNKKTLLHVPDDMLKKLSEAPEEIWASYDVRGTLLAMTVIDKTKVATS